MTIQRHGFNDADEESESEGSFGELPNFESEEQSTASGASDARSAVDIYAEPTRLQKFRSYMNDGDGRIYHGFGVGAITVGNAVALGLETDFGCMTSTLHCSESDYIGLFASLDYVFLSLFIAEQMLRALLQGPKLYFTGVASEDRRAVLLRYEVKLWKDKAVPIYLIRINLLNLLDVALVFCRFLDLVMRLAGIATALKTVSALRIVNSLTAILKVRPRGILKELTIILGCVGDTVKTVSWVFAVIMMFTYAFAILLTTLIGHDEGALTVALDFSPFTVEEYWSTVPKSLYTLFQMLTFDNWSMAVIYPVSRRYPVVLLCTIFFFVVGVLSLMSMVTAVVVQSTLSSARQSNEEEAKEEEEASRKILNSLERIFYLSDTDGSGSIERDELEAMLVNPAVRDRLRILDIPLKDLEMLYTLLDDTECNSVAIDRFFRGASRLQGKAKSADLHHMSVDMARHGQVAQELTEKIEETNANIFSLLEMMDDVDREIVKGDGEENDPVLKSRKGRARAKGGSRASRGRQDDEPAPRMTSKVSQASERRSSLMDCALRTTSSEMHLDKDKQSKERSTSKGVQWAEPRKSERARRGSAGFQWGVH
eukprot:TRINITY_DN74023_c0_g1_i1.p1 TRINITY_DN74023_c0_g1~~TRINITY_DN74023_c0_g1_i1.p1  ORF type:complete len:598 (-),score=96.42 TRINITY_DN74023_c0_g1_i1:105-1898(-)